MINLDLIDEQNNVIYYQSTSPDQATREYLYRVPLDGSRPQQQVSPFDMPGTHNYTFSPNGQYALWRFSNYFTPPKSSWISLPDHQPLPGQKDLFAEYDPSKATESNVTFFEMMVEDSVRLDCWMAKPNDFDPEKKYPVVFYVYAEPASTTSTRPSVSSGRATTARARRSASVATADLGGLSDMPGTLYQVLLWPLKSLRVHAPTFSVAASISLRR